MPHYKGWSRGKASAEVTDGPGTSANHDPQSLLSTGPVVLGFTPVNYGLVRNVSSSKDAPVLDLERTLRKRIASQKADDIIHGKPVKQARIRTDNIQKTKTNHAKNPKGENPLKHASSPSRTTQPSSGLGDDPALWKLPEHVPQLHSDDLDEGISNECLLSLVDDFNENPSKEGHPKFVDDPDDDVCVDDHLNSGSDLGNGVSDEDLLCIVNAFEQNKILVDSFVPAYPRLNWMTPRIHQQPQQEAASNSFETREQGIAVENNGLTNEVIPAPPSSPSSSVFSSMPVKDSRFTPLKLATSDTYVSPASVETPRHLDPFLNPPVPVAVGERSPITGVSPHARIVTHFRLGQALKFAAACHNQVRAQHAIVELYARVLQSARQGGRQRFELADLFHYNRPPYLSAEWVGWKGLPYFELDGDAFLGEGSTRKICRAIGKVERDGSATSGWRMCILSIWEAGWDDVETVKGIVCI